jgi:hypothetical protein
MKLHVLVVVIGGLVAACGASQKQTENLVATSTQFQEGLRWQRFEDSATHVPAEAREAFLDERDTLADDLRIDDYEVLRVRVRGAQTEAVLQVKYTWHLDSKGVVHETVTEQLWRRRGVKWLIVSEVRRRGEPMPGVGEPPEPDAPSDGSGVDHTDGAPPDEAPAARNTAPAKPRGADHPEAPETP